jgi:hypothetical protein
VLRTFGNGPSTRKISAVSTWPIATHPKNNIAPRSEEEEEEEEEEGGAFVKKSKRVIET